MEEWNLFLRLLLMIVLLSSSLAKLKEMEKHIGVVIDYRILPKRLAPTFARIDVAVELFIGLGLAFGLWQRYLALGAGLLLLSYTVAIIVNLLRGRTEVSCGCGGVVGNHQLSWWLVLRNLVLVIGCGWLATTNSLLLSVDGMLEGLHAVTVFGYRAWQGLLLSSLALLLLFLAIELRAVGRRMATLLNEYRRTH